MIKVNIKLSIRILLEHLSLVNLLFYMFGWLVFQGVLSSYSWPIAQIKDSDIGFPIICNPIGNPESLIPHGKVKEGYLLKSKGTVNFCTAVPARELSFGP